MSCRPQLGALSRFRDQIAHGRSERLAPQAEVVAWSGDIDDYLNTRPATEWERHLADDRFANRARRQVQAALERLHAHRTDEKEAVFMTGMTVGSASMARGQS